MKKKLRGMALVLTLAVILSMVPAAARADGSMTSVGSVAAGDFLSYLLLPEGTVLATGNRKNSAYYVSHWTDIVKVAAYNVVLGLRSDGRVEMSGDADRSFDVSGWYDITDIAVGVKNAIGLKRDGTVVFTGPYIEGQDRMRYWTDIVQVAADDSAYYGLRRDGTVVCVSSNSSSKTRCTSWRGIVAISAAMSHVLGLRSDGRVVAEGSDLHGQCQVGSWRNVVKIAAGNHHSVALLADGRVVCTGENDYGQCNTQIWRDIVDISAGMYHTIGLRRDGQVVAVGSDGYGQCRISELNSISLGGGPSYVPAGVYLNELSWYSKYGKLWTRSAYAPSGYAHTKKDAPGCWSDMSTPGHTQAIVRDANGNEYTYGLHVDGDRSEDYYVSYLLSGNYRWFSGTVGYPAIVISDTYAPQYTKYINIYGDGRLLYTSRVTGSGRSSDPFCIDVSGVRVLKIEYPATSGPNEAATLFDGWLS